MSLFPLKSMTQFSSPLPVPAVQTLVPTTALDFPIVSITVSRSGRYIALVGESALAVLDAQSTKATESLDVTACT